MKSRKRSGASWTVPGKASSMASVAFSRLYIGIRMSTWWGTWTMIQWKKKLRPNRARSTVVPSIWPLNFVHSRRFHHRIDGCTWCTWTKVAMM